MGETLTEPPGRRCKSLMTRLLFCKGPVWRRYGYVDVTLPEIKPGVAAIETQGDEVGRCTYISLLADKVC